MSTTGNAQVAGKTVLVTGASGGIGGELVHAFLDAGAARIFAAGRGAALPAGDRVIPIALDLLSASSVAHAARMARDADVVVNNAGFNGNLPLEHASLENAQAEMDVNYLGLLRVYREFAPAMKSRRSGTFVNMLTVLAHVNHPLMATYCASKAAALSLTQAMRADLALYGVRVRAVFPAAVDTRMSAHVPPPKLSPAQLAREVVASLQGEADDLYPGLAAGLRDSLQKDWKAVERMFAARHPGHA